MNRKDRRAALASIKKTSPWADWSIQRFAHHYAVTMISEPPVSPIFGTTKNIMMTAAIRFGEAAVYKAFMAAVKKKDPEMKGTNS